jgi:hypothetical protein
MYSVPDVDEVVAVAKHLGIHLSADEAAAPTPEGNRYER